MSEKIKTVDLLLDIKSKLDLIDLRINTVTENLHLEQVESGQEFVPIVQWTNSKTDLIELIYALHSSGAFNRGKCTIREITLFFEQTFGLKLENTSKVFQEILRRKESAAFLDRLKDKLELHITRIEEKHLR